MAPHATTNASFMPSPTLSPPQTPQPTTPPFGSFNQSQWGPDAIGTIFFGIVMFFIGVIALWQGRLRRLKHEEDEEQGRRTGIADLPADFVDEGSIVDSSEGARGERAPGKMVEQPREDDVMGEGFVMIETGRRTDTEGTLVGRDDDEGAEK